MSDTYGEPINDDGIAAEPLDVDAPSELEHVRAVFGTEPDDELAGDEPEADGVYPPLMPGEEYDLSQTWEGPTESEWQQTRDTIHALASMVEEREQYAAYDDEFGLNDLSLDPLDEGFEGQLGNLLAARDQALITAVANKLGPLMQSVQPLLAAQHEQAVASGESRLSEIVAEESRHGRFDPEVARDLARAELRELAEAGVPLDDAAAEKALRGAAERLRGTKPTRSRSSSPRSSSAPGKVKDAETEWDVVRQLFKDDTPSWGPGE